MPEHTPTRRLAPSIRVFRLGDEPGDDLSATTTPEERIAMMWRLTLDAWAMAGRSIPDYPRNRAPVRIITLAEHLDSVES